MHTATIATTPIIGKVVRSSFIRKQPVQVQNSGYVWGPAGAVGSVVGGTGQAVQAVFYGAGGVVGEVLGGVFGGVSALFGGPGYSYAPANSYGGPFARRSMRPAQSPRRPSRWSAAPLEGRRLPAPGTSPVRQRGARCTATRALRCLNLDGESLPKQGRP